MRMFKNVDFSIEGNYCLQHSLSGTEHSISMYMSSEEILASIATLFSLIPNFHDLLYNVIRDVSQYRPQQDENQVI